MDLMERDYNKEAKEMTANMCNCHFITLTKVR